MTSSADPLDSQRRGEARPINERSQMTTATARDGTVVAEERGRHDRLLGLFVVACAGAETAETQVLRHRRLHLLWFPGYTMLDDGSAGRRPITR